MTNIDKRQIQNLFRIYQEIRETIELRLEEFRTKWRDSSERELFAELAFCLLTPQSKAKVCWAAIERLQNSGKLYEGDYDAILSELKGVRFKIRKAEYILNARKIFQKDGHLNIRAFLKRWDSPFRMREWLVKSVKGMGYKEASHFLRNIGLGERLAILDRHILKNLKLLGVIEDIPKSMTRTRYLETESKMAEFAQNIGIPLDQLDLLLWYKETGEVFK